MLKIIKKENTSSDTILRTNVQGKLIKIHIRSKQELPDVIVKIETIDKEIIFQGNLDQRNLNIFPVNTIVKGDTELVDYYRLYPDNIDSTNLFIQITGLKEGEKIDLIKVLYEYDQVIMVSQ